MRMRHCCLQAVFLGILIFLMATSRPLLAQTATGSILGTVTDPSGAVVSGATVTIKSLSTGATRTLTTTQAGTYSAAALEPGQYTVNFRQTGFGPGEQRVEVRVGQTANGDFRLKVGEQSTSVQVNAESVSPV